MEAFETFEHAGCTIGLYQDMHVEPPNESMDMFGTFGHWHRSYLLGDTDLRRGEHSAAFERSQQTRFGLAYLKRYLELCEHAVCIVPVGMIDHSGITVYAGGGSHASDAAGWDSGTVGLYWCTRAEAEHEGFSGEDAQRCILGEIKTWAAYLEGAVHGYVVTDNETGEEVDACWGYYPDDSGDGLEYTRSEARHAARWHRDLANIAAKREQAERERCANLDIATREVTAA